MNRDFLEDRTNDPDFMDTLDEVTAEVYDLLLTNPRIRKREACALLEIDPVRWKKTLEKLKATFVAGVTLRVRERHPYKGKLLTIKEIAAEAGLKYQCVRDRIARGWSAEKIVSTPSKGAKG